MRTRFGFVAAFFLTSMLFVPSLSYATSSETVVINGTSVSLTDVSGSCAAGFTDCFTLDGLGATGPGIFGTEFDTFGDFTVHGLPGLGGQLNISDTTGLDVMVLTGLIFVADSSSADLSVIYSANGFASPGTTYFFGTYIGGQYVTSGDPSASSLSMTCTGVFDTGTTGCGSVTANLSTGTFFEQQVTLTEITCTTDCGADLSYEISGTFRYAGDVLVIATSSHGAGGPVAAAVTANLSGAKALDQAHFVPEPSILLLLGSGLVGLGLFRRIRRHS